MSGLYELADTALKIGLGAMISGLSAYWLSNSQYKRKTSEQRQQQQRMLIEDAAVQAEQIHYIFLKYFELMQEYMHSLQNRYDWPQTRRSELYLVLDELVQGFNNLTAAESKLLLLNEKNLYKSLRKMRSRIVFFRRQFYIDKKDLNEQEALEIRRDVGKMREEFFDALSAKYADM